MKKVPCIPAIALLSVCVAWPALPLAAPGLPTFPALPALATLLLLLAAGSAVCLLLRRAIDADDRARELARATCSRQPQAHDGLLLPGAPAQAPPSPACAMPAALDVADRRHRSHWHGPGATPVPVQLLNVNPDAIATNQ